MALSKCGLASGLRLSTASRKPVSSSNSADLGLAAAAFLIKASAPAASPRAFSASACCFSCAAGGPAAAMDRQALNKRIRRNIRWSSLYLGLYWGHVGGPVVPCDVGGRSLRGSGVLQAAPVDRKSTRLNSSHLGISYAV